jgi:hypothetical protein
VPLSWCCLKACLPIARTAIAARLWMVPAAFNFEDYPRAATTFIRGKTVDNGAWLNPAFLNNYEPYRRSFQIGDGQKATVDVVAAPVAP